MISKLYLWCLLDKPCPLPYPWSPRHVQKLTYEGLERQLICLVIYPGKDDEGYAGTSIRFYKTPNTDSFLQAFKELIAKFTNGIGVVRKQLLSFTWRRADEAFKRGRYRNASLICWQSTSTISPTHIGIVNKQEIEVRLIMKEVTQSSNFREWIMEHWFKGGKEEKE